MQARALSRVPTTPLLNAMYRHERGSNFRPPHRRLGFVDEGQYPGARDPAFSSDTSAMTGMIIAVGALIGLFVLLGTRPHKP